MRHDVDPGYEEWVAVRAGIFWVLVLLSVCGVIRVVQWVF